MRRLSLCILLLLGSSVSLGTVYAQTCRTLIVFASDIEGNYDLFLANPDGTAVQRITDYEGVDSFPTWSPDGTQIAFVSDRDSAPDVFQIYILTLATGAITRLTNEGVNTWPDWSPDGERLVFASSRDDGQWDLYTIKVDGSGETALMHTPDRHEFWPNWSPDGTQIAYSAETPDTDWEGIFVVDDTGSEARLLVDLAGDDLAPRWTPDGAAVAFDHFEDTWNIYLADAVTGEAEPLLDDPNYSEYLISFSPDGTQAVYVRQEGSFQTFVTDFDGGLTRIGGAGINNVFPDWSSCLTGAAVGTVPAVIAAETACKAHTLQVLDLYEQPSADEGRAVGVLRAGQSALLTEVYTDAEGVLWWYVQTGLPPQRGWLRADAATAAGRCDAIWEAR